MVDYGKAIKELAGANIFPGDMLMKNFGVTRWGRVVFYDYDEICPLTECQFKCQKPRIHWMNSVARATSILPKTTYFRASLKSFLAPISGRLSTLMRPIKIYLQLLCGSNSKRL